MAVWVKRNDEQYAYFMSIIHISSILIILILSFQQIQLMQNDQKQVNQVKAIILLQVEHVFMHRLLKTQKTLFTSGTLKIAKLQSGRPNPAYFINIGSFYYGINQDVYFIKVIYQDTISYVFPHFQNGLSAISLLADSPVINNFEEILSNAAKLFDYAEAIEQPYIKSAIQEHYPILEKEQIFYPDNIKKVITTSGKFFNNIFTSVGGYLKTGVEKAGNYLNSKVQQGEPTQIKPQTKQKWQNLKNGTTKVIQISADYANKFLTPVFEKTKQYTNELKTKIDHSDNQTIKYAKQLVQVSGRAIQQAFDGLVKGGTEVTKQLGQQSIKLITKKYGDQVIKTFTSQKQQTVSEQHNQANQKEEQSQVQLEETSKQNLNNPSLLK